MEWHGYELEEGEFEGHLTRIVFPKEARGRQRYDRALL